MNLNDVSRVIASIYSYVRSYSPIERIVSSRTCWPPRRTATIPSRSEAFRAPSCSRYYTYTPFPYVHIPIQCPGVMRRTYRYIAAARASIRLQSGVYVQVRRLPLHVRDHASRGAICMGSGARQHLPLSRALRRFLQLAALYSQLQMCIGVYVYRNCVGKRAAATPSLQDTGWPTLRYELLVINDSDYTGLRTSSVARKLSVCIAGCVQRHDRSEGRRRDTCVEVTKKYVQHEGDQRILEVYG